MFLIIAKLSLLTIVIATIMCKIMKGGGCYKKTKLGKHEIRTRRFNESKKLEIRNVRDNLCYLNTIRKHYFL